MPNYKKRSQKREKKIAKDIGGRTTPGSGSLWYQKSDAYSEHLRIEDKFTDADSFRIQYSILNKIEKEAFTTDKIPVLSLGFTQSKENYAIIRKLDCIKVYDLPVFSTGNKSYLLKNDCMRTLYLKSKGIMLFEIMFNFYNKSYYVMTWKDLVENQDIFLI